MVTGPARGQMWHDDAANDNGVTPLPDDDGQPLDFAGWYRRWLDEAEHTAESQALPLPTSPATPRRSWPRRLLW